MSNFSANYGKILETLQQFENKMNFLNQIRKPRLSDIELILISCMTVNAIIFDRTLFLNPSKDLAENGKVYPGDYLMKVGIDAFTATRMNSRVIELTAE